MSLLKTKALTSKKRPLTIDRLRRLYNIKALLSQSKVSHFLLEKDCRGAHLFWLLPGPEVCFWRLASTASAWTWKQATATLNQ